MAEEFQEVEFMRAATLICLRKKSNNISTCAINGRNRYQVLLGQNEVVNWLKSTSTQTFTMRYPGEWKFPGGVFEQQDHSLEMTALREFQEEFLGITCPINEIRDSMKLFNQKITLAIQGRQYEMNNFVVYDDNNIWNDEEIDRVNSNLSTKKLQFLETLANGKFWVMNQEEKSRLSPEVYQLKWIDLDEAIALMESSLSHHHPHHQSQYQSQSHHEHQNMKYVNEWQQEEFNRYGILKRDPMYQSMMTLIEINESHER